jgi:hypothetical protein
VPGFVLWSTVVSADTQKGVWPFRMGVVHSDTQLQPYKAIRTQASRCGYLKQYYKALEYKYRVKTVALDTLKRYSIISLTLYLEWYNAYSILYSSGPH